VLALVERLRNDGIDAIVDQMHLTLGAYSPEFMERAVRESDRVLVICTEKYKERFDSREGGAGYEGHIITGEIVNEVGKNKFIPILRKGDWKTAIPTALSGVNGVDLRNEATTEYQKLIKNLYNVSPITPIGSRPSWLYGLEARLLKFFRVNPDVPMRFRPNLAKQICFWQFLALLSKLLRIGFLSNRDSLLKTLIG